MSVWNRLSLLMLVAGLCRPVYGAYLESDYSAGQPVQPPEPPEPPRREIAPPPVGGGEAVRRQVRGVEVGAPFSHRALTVFPLFRAGAGRPGGTGTLDEALDRGWLTIREKESAHVPEVAVRNHSDHEVFLMAGEVIRGGRQNRIIRDDVLLPARSDFVFVPVYCVERDRWAGDEPGFESAGVLAHPRLREYSTRGAEQGEIWREVDEQLRRANVASPTLDYQRVYEDARVSGELDACIRQFRRRWPRRTVGAVFTHGNRIVCADIFADPRVFSQLWEKLCRSQAVDYLVRPAPAWGGITAQDVRAFLNGVYDAHFSDRHTPGLGRLVRISGPVAGSALVRDGESVHTALFPGHAVRPMPMREERE
ncbi:MAG: hypothetical protein JXR37_12860 [Kiritimatiellae bacterium]|nr:hypothetical protein [Kiritimatiellia bacterium]